MWHVLRVQSRAEFEVCETLERLGLETLVPVKWVWRRVSRHAQKQVPIKLAILPGYVFVKRVPYLQWQDVFATKKCYDLLRWGEYPANIRDDQIQHLIDASEAEPKEPEIHRFLTGQKVKITSGPFKGAILDLTSVKKKTAKGLLKFFRSTMEIEIAVENLETV